eukprot:2378183-Rhodomonas_salina.1
MLAWSVHAVARSGKLLPDSGTELGYAPMQAMLAWSVHALARVRYWYAATHAMPPRGRTDLARCWRGQCTRPTTLSASSSYPPPYPIALCLAYALSGTQLQ